MLCTEEQSYCVSLQNPWVMKGCHVPTEGVNVKKSSMLLLKKKMKTREDGIKKPCAYSFFIYVF